MTAPGDVDPEFERLLKLHQAIIQGGGRWVIAPVFLMMGVTAVVLWIVATALLAREAWGGLWILPVLLALGFCASWMLHYKLLARWYRDAVARATDIALLHELGMGSKLFWPADSFFGRREAPLLERIRSEVLVLRRAEERRITPP